MAAPAVAAIVAFLTGAGAWSSRRSQAAQDAKLRAEIHRLGLAIAEGIKGE